VIQLLKVLVVEGGVIKGVALMVELAYTLQPIGIIGHLSNQVQSTTINYQYA